MATVKEVIMFLCKFLVKHWTRQAKKTAKSKVRLVISWPILEFSTVLHTVLSFSCKTEHFVKTDALKLTFIGIMIQRELLILRR